VLEPSHGERALDLRDLWQSRDVAYVLVLRVVTVRFIQTALAVACVLLQLLLATCLSYRQVGKYGDPPSGQLTWRPPKRRLLCCVEQSPLALAATGQLPRVIVEECSSEVILWRYALIQNLGEGSGHGADVVAQVVKRGRLAEDALDPFIESAADEFRRTNAFPFGGLVKAAQTDRIEA